ncbi:antibiotic biosynthesis monooxygenase [Veillonella caviae]|uniref:antibiotic biosynthesis monooxygenase n=1 Tax=Veillonella caviae TaxID=248316 RepID=UPI0023F659E6|nr:antibiotic biosynthesis monooxygenase [Veillonella caviae]
MNKKLLKRILLTTAIGVLGIASASALSFDNSDKVDSTPIVGFYQFQVPEELQGDYNSVGVANFTKSMETELNTLSMNVAHVQGDPSKSYILEVYKDGNALELHRKSEQYQHYINEVGSKLNNRKVFDVQPVLLLEKTDALSIINDGKAIVTITQYNVDINELDAVQRLVQLDIERALRDDEGYKAGYVIREANGKNYWRTIQIYSDEEAYKKHISSPGYRYMISQIQPYIQNVKITVLDGDILVNHGGQSFVRN